MASSSEDWQVIGGEEGGDSVVMALDGDKESTHRDVERLNLLNMLKIAVKALIDSSMRLGRTLTDDHPPLVQVLILLEHILKHRLKVRRSMLGQKRSFWGLIESFERSSPEFAEGIANIRTIPGIKTMLGRGRAWLRFVLMQKKLADHFRTILENRAVLTEWYESGSTALSDESTVVAGLLVGINTIDYNVLMKGEEFDKSPGVLDLSQYLRDGNYLARPAAEEEDEESHLANLLDQKAYLEELNRKLESSVGQLQERADKAEVALSAATERLELSEETLVKTTLERDEFRDMNERSSAELRKTLENLQDDQRAELETYVQSRAGLNDLYSATQKSLGTENKLRVQLEQELEVQKSIRQEKETALQLLETSTHEKQDTIVALRKQLEEMKTANLKMQGQLKSAKDNHQKDSIKIRNLESRLSQLTTVSKQTEKELTSTQSKLQESLRTSGELAGKLEEVQLARSTAESDLTIEKQWRASLQMEIQREKDRVVELTNETKKFKSLKKEHAELQEKYAVLQETVSEQEIAMVEMGKQLSLSQQKVIDMKEVNTAMKESVWQDDKDITNCQLCKKTFSVARRKHHCRNCGGVFCQPCSENALQLASSSKPVRVCDSCYQLLLERSST